MLNAITAMTALQGVSSTLKKQEVLREFSGNEDFRKLLYYALNPMLTYKISEQTLRRPARYDPAITLTSGRLVGTLGAFVLNYKGNEVRVGSGFTDKQRDAYWRRREELAGVLCEVKYKEISSDKNTGAESLQFPVFLSLRTDKEDVSYG